MTQQDLMPEGEETAPPGWRFMSVVRWLLVAAMAAAAVASVAWYAGAMPRTQAVAAGTQVYTCPMHPQIHQDRPGECPICHMDLVLQATAPPPAVPPSEPGKIDAPPGLAEVMLTPERLQLLSLRTEPVMRRELREVRRWPTTLEAAEDRLVSVQPRFAGWIETLAVAQTGEAVKKGDLLARVYSPQVQQIEGEFLAAQGIVGAEAAVRQRLQTLGESPSELADLARTRTLHRTIALRAPAAGVVLDKTARQGAAFGLGTALFTIADLATVWALVDVPETDLDRLHVGDPATLLLANGVEVQAQVAFLPPTTDATTRTWRARLEVPNPEGRLRPGLTATATLTLGVGTTLAVPRAAVIDTGEFRYVFVDAGGGRFQPRRVQTGLRTDDWTEVKAGLAEGERVVAGGSFLLDAESRLAGVSATVAPAAPGTGDPFDCSREFSGDKARQCRACDTVHRGMGSMVDDCKNAIPKPWK